MLDGIVTDVSPAFFVCCSFNPSGTSANDELVFIVALIV
jgi:hypothetical protein